MIIIVINNLTFLYLLQNVVGKKFKKKFSFYFFNNAQLSLFLFDFLFFQIYDFNIFY